MSVQFSQDIIERKHVLLDTCFLIKAAQYVDTPFFDSAFKYLSDANSTPIINQMIYFEYLRGCKTRTQISTKNQYLNSISQVILPITKDILDDTLKISNIYSHKNIQSTQIGFVDVCNSAFLKKYINNVILLTLDNNDYPLIIHDRIGIITIDCEKEINNLGFYKFNQAKFEKCLIELNRT